MPFQSQAQRGFMFKNHPEIAKRWAAEYPNQGKLPQHKNPRDGVVEALTRRKMPKL